MYVFTYTRSMINTRVYSIWKSGPQYYRKESVHTHTYIIRDVVKTPNLNGKTLK